MQHFKHPSIFDDAFFGPAQLVSALNSTIFWSSLRRIYKKPSSQLSKPSSPATVMLKMSSHEMALVQSDGSVGTICLVNVCQLLFGVPFSAWAFQPV